MQSLDLQLAHHASSLTYAALTPHALERAKVFLLDTLGVGIAGGSTPEIQPLLKAVRSWGEGAEAAVWGTDLKLPRHSHVGMLCGQREAVGECFRVIHDVYA